jgi:hypothetical protein
MPPRGRMEALSVERRGSPIKFWEESRQGRGHLWIFLDPIAARPVREVLKRVVEEGKVRHYETLMSIDKLRLTTCVSRVAECSGATSAARGVGPPLALE